MTVDDRHERKRVGPEDEEREDLKGDRSAAQKVKDAFAAENNQPMSDTEPAQEPNR
ncbi:hypothetical protein [Mangrovicella endophytica]|uniref:hypothetical protein n=1 Tax=Mangrovicella endophytica TaxID=2066697 RepID=UPI0012FFF9D0|nr:hypothetical protein [Mangrovicella endophytica]